VPLAPDVDLDRIAASIPGSTGADIALLVNEAALFAARRNHTKVEQSDFTDSIEKILLGAERQVVMTDADRRRTAYHESGHALVGMLTPGADPVRKISIIPRGQALGVTLSTPESDRYKPPRGSRRSQGPPSAARRGEVVSTRRPARSPISKPHAGRSRWSALG
jgi:cell division protease FtsH